MLLLLITATAIPALSQETISGRVVGIDSGGMRITVQPQNDRSAVEVDLSVVQPVPDIRLGQVIRATGHYGNGRLFLATKVISESSQPVEDPTGVRSRLNKKRRHRLPP